MRDKHHDDFFDEDKGGLDAEKKLIDMVDSHGGSKATFRKGQKVSGKVVRIGTSYVSVDIGAKNEAVIKTVELLDKEKNLPVVVGDTLEGFVVSDSDGEIVMSLSQTAHLGSVADLVDAMREKVPVSGKVTGINKGGINVKVMGQRAFCPASQIDTKFVEDINVYFGKTMNFVISRVTEGGRNIVLTRVPLLEREMEGRLDELTSGSTSRQVLQGTVTRIAPFGLFVDLGQVEGLVHVSEVAWDRVEDLQELYSVGQSVDCVVLDVKKGATIRDTKVSLSIKQVDENPWASAADRFPPGTQAEGTVTRLADFGAFVRLAPGIEGLVHVSEMSWGKRVRHPKDLLAVGQSVRVSVLRVDGEKGEISLSLKDIQDDPWSHVPQRYASGTLAKGTVASRTQFGYFVDLEDGVTGLLPHGNVGSEVKGGLVVGKEIEVRVESVDTERRRMSLSFGVQQEGPQDQEVREYLTTQAGTPEADTSVSDFGSALKDAMNRKKG